LSAGFSANEIKRRGYSGTGAVGPAGVAGGAGAGGRAIEVDVFLLALAALLALVFVDGSGFNGNPPTPNAIPLTTNLLGPLLRYPIASPAALSANTM
jgi:hypothetical protein